MRLFSKIFSGEVRKWFKDIPDMDLGVEQTD
jgi:hypothetical protein